MAKDSYTVNVRTLIDEDSVLMLYMEEPTENSSGKKVDIPIDKHKWIEKVMKEFDEVQKYLDEKYNE